MGLFSAFLSLCDPGWLSKIHLEYLEYCWLPLKRDKEGVIEGGEEEGREGERENEQTLEDPTPEIKSQSKKMTRLVTQSWLTLSDSVDCSPWGSSVHGIFQAWILGWVAISSSGDLPDPEMEPVPPSFLHRRRILDYWATGEAPVQTKQGQNSDEFLS